jgi:hypothetical protein
VLNARQTAGKEPTLFGFDFSFARHLWSAASSAG